MSFRPKERKEKPTGKAHLKLRSVVLDSIAPEVLLVTDEASLNSVKAALGGMESLQTSGKLLTDCSSAPAQENGDSDQTLSSREMDIIKSLDRYLYTHVLYMGAF